MGMNPFSFVCRERECVSERERGVCVCVCVCRSGQEQEQNNRQQKVGPECPLQAFEAEQ